MDLQALGAPGAGVGHVGKADSVAGEGRRPLQLVHGHVDGVTQGTVQHERPTGQLQ